MLYELVHGRAPFTGVHPKEISDKIKKGNIRFKIGVSKEYKDLVNKLLTYEMLSAFEVLNEQIAFIFDKVIS